jgi:hypothetical protein
LPADVAGVTAGLSAFLGHLFPIYIRFRGGKGVATGGGVVCVLVPVPAIGALLSWVVVVCASRYVSLASMLAAVVLCLLRLAGTPTPFLSKNAILTFFCLAATILVFVRHHANIGRLLNGTENRMKESTSMFTLAKTLHVLVLGLWFGMAVFFSLVVGFALFGAFEKEALKERGDRPSWFPAVEAYEKEPPSKQFPDPLRQEQGTRAAGYAIGPLFHWYFILQVVCAAVALVTALGWTGERFRGKVHKVRVALLLLALLGVAGGWGLEKKVSDLRIPRDDRTDEVLKTPKPTHEQIKEAEQARATFGMWHGISVMLNLLVILLVTGAMALAAQLPAGQPPHSTESSPATS